MPQGVEENLIILPWNDADVLADVIEREGENIAAVLTEPVMCNTGCILPQPGYLEAMRELTQRHGIVLIFDEVITGFRLGLGGAQARLGINPDLSVFAKGLGGGFPVAAMGGRPKSWRSSPMAPSRWPARTPRTASPSRRRMPRSTNWPPRASIRTRCGFRRIAPRSWTDLPRRGPAGNVVGVGPLMQVWFSTEEIHNYRDAERHADQALFRRWWEGMLAHRILFHPGAYENLFVSTAHTHADVAATLDAARKVARTLA